MFCIDWQCNWPRTPRKALRQTCLLRESQRFSYIGVCLSATGWIMLNYPQKGINSASIWDIWVCLKMRYTPNYSHLVGIMISKTIGCRGFLYFQTNPYRSCRRNMLQVARLNPRMWLKPRLSPMPWHGQMSLQSQPRPWKKCPPHSGRNWLLINFWEWSMLDIFFRDVPHF